MAYAKIYTAATGATLSFWLRRTRDDSAGIGVAAPIMASATPMCLSVQGKRTDAPEHRGVRGLRHHAECLQVADVVIEATW